MSFTSSYFPLVTFCDMERQILGKMEINTLQCVLMLNFINEKIFIMIWYWIFLLFFISLADFIITFVQYVLPQCREISIKFYLQEGELDEWSCFLLKDKRLLRIYVVEFLGLDGALLLRFLDNHAGIIVTRIITNGLWQYFCRFYGDSSFCTSREIVVNVEKFEIADSYSLSLSPIASLSRMN
ncbi:unnamed protein product [Onchocerca flexuosa]|uniref:Innexin n=1 Tax=Onchocerca flexuosa TaxID=387005 RepID=A0A183HC67_9BILA|nr:unnamed protein product [Onchocerca flexuosa]